MKLPLVALGVSELTIYLLSQIGVIPDQLFNIFAQLPVVGLFAWYVLHSNKQTREWLNHLLETQDKRHQRAIESQDSRHKDTVRLFEKIFDRIDKRQGEMNQQLAINAATASEISKISELIGKLEQR